MKKYLNKFRIKLIKLLLPEKIIWEVSSDIAERFYKKDSGEYDILQDKLDFWIRSGIEDKLLK